MFVFKKSKFYFALSLSAATIFVFLGSNRLLHYQHYKKLESQNRELQLKLQVADALDEDNEAVTIYKNLKSSAPEIQLRILQRQWSIAIDLLHQIQLAEANAFLMESVPVLFTKLNQHLNGMKDRCSDLLDRKAQGKDVTWRAYNMRGCVKLLTAYVVLENEKNWKKVQAIIREAISDLKSAIEIVDQTNATAVDKNTPRWNLELLHGKQYVREFATRKMGDQTRLDLKENLEALIPQRGGYAPGVPIDMRIRK